jgi:hypothetical protein
MASKVSSILRVVGRNIKDPGSVMYHAADGVGPSGALNKGKRHSMRKALHKMRLRASGMTDDLYGSKEVDGTLHDPYEHIPKK